MKAESVEELSIEEIAERIRARMSSKKIGIYPPLSPSEDIFRHFGLENTPKVPLISQAEFDKRLSLAMRKAAKGKNTS